MTNTRDFILYYATNNNWWEIENKKNLCIFVRFIVILICCFVRDDLQFSRGLCFSRIPSSKTCTYITPWPECTYALGHSEMFVKRNFYDVLFVTTKRILSNRVFNIYNTNTQRKNCVFGKNTYLYPTRSWQTFNAYLHGSTIRYHHHRHRRKKRSKWIGT